MPWNVKVAIVAERPLVRYLWRFSTGSIIGRRKQGFGSWMPSAASYPTAKYATDAAFSSEPPSLSGRAADLPPSAYGSALRQRVRARCPTLEEGEASRDTAGRKAV